MLETGTLFSGLLAILSSAYTVKLFLKSIYVDEGRILDGEGRPQRQKIPYVTLWLFQQFKTNNCVSLLLYFLFIFVWVKISKKK